MKHDLQGFAGTPRYTPLRLLGAGGMGAVYEVEDKTSGGRVALKVMVADEAGRLLRFKQEFRVMAELHHPNLVRLFDLGQHEDRWFFTMELVTGSDLLDVLLTEEPGEAATVTVAAIPRLRGGNEALDLELEPLASRYDGGSGPRLAGLPPKASLRSDGPPRVGPEHTNPQPGPACDPEALVRVVAQILDALEYLHGQGIVHRDLKPANILVDLEGVVRVLDFGLASRLDRDAAISQEGALVGTLAYLSPEQYRGEQASPASDLYALGCLMFQLLTGDLPFQGPPMHALAARVERPPPRVEDRVSGVPEVLADVVLGLMARSPEERPTIARVRAALGFGSGPRSTVRASRGEGGKPASATNTAEIFVGRKREMAQLAGSIERAAGGELGLVFVSGPSGIGKSALGAMAVRRATRLGFSCFSGRCYEREQVPFVAFDRVVDAMTLTFRRWPAEDLAALLPAFVEAERLFPALGMLTGGSSPEARRPRAAEDPRELSRKAFDAFGDILEAAQRRAPLCLVLDDLQWADEESVALLEAVLARGAGRLLILALHRSEALPEGHPFERLRKTLSDGHGATSITLTALGSADSVHLVEAVTKKKLDPTTSAALVDQAGGNPFLVRRLAEHLAGLGPEEQAAELADPGSADDLLRRMIEGLGPAAEQILALAATAGGDIRAALLREVSGLAHEDFDLAVSELLAGRFLKAVPLGGHGSSHPGLPHIDVYQDRIREVAYRNLGEERRAALHRALALALEARPGDPGRDAEALVRHWTLAGEPARRRRHAIAAAEEAEKKLAFTRAARLFRLVLEDPEPGEPALVTAARWERVGELFEYGGLHLEAARAHEEAIALWDAAPEHHPSRDEARLRLRGLAGANLLATPCVAEGRARFEEGLTFLGHPLDRSWPERLAILGALAGRIAVEERLPTSVLHRLGAPRARSARARLLAEEVRFHDLLIRGFQPFWTAPAAESALRAQLLGRRIDDYRVLQRSLAFGAAAPVLLGHCTPEQLERAHRRLDAADELARVHQLPMGRELVQLNRGLLWMATSHERARKTCERALEGFKKRGLLDSFDGDLARTYYLMILVAKGDAADALATIEQELARPHENHVCRTIALALRANVLSWSGDLAGGWAAVERVEAALGRIPTSRLTLSFATVRAQLLVVEGRFDEVLASAPDVRRDAESSGAWALAFDRAYWLEQELEAALGALRRGTLRSADRKRLRDAARWLAAEGLFDLICLGHRALALLDFAEGKRPAAMASLNRALALSSTNTSPRHRWLCLEAAREMGAITLDAEAEAAELVAAERFVFPGRGAA